MSNRLLNAVQRTAAGIAMLAAAAAVHASPAQAGSIITTNCLHGSGADTGFAYRDSYSDSYGSGYGRSYSDAFSGEGRRGFGERVNGFGERVRRGFGERVRPGVRIGGGSGGGSSSGAEAGTASGYDGGQSSGSGWGSARSYSDGGCVETRRELVNPYLIHMPQPQTEQDVADAATRERLWQARCRPVIRQDQYGVRRYHYAAPGCEYGKYE